MSAVPESDALFPFRPTEAELAEFVRGHADRLGRRPMTAAGDERDDDLCLVDSYVFGYDPHAQMIALGQRMTPKRAAEILATYLRESGREPIPADFFVHPCERRRG